MDAAAEIWRNPAIKHQVHPEYEEWAGRGGTGRPKPSRETKFSGANGDKEIMLIFPVQLTTTRVTQDTLCDTFKTFHSSNLLTPDREQSWSTWIIVVYTRPAIIGYKKPTGHASIGFDRQAQQVSQGHTWSCKNKKIAILRPITAVEALSWGSYNPVHK